MPYRCLALALTASLAFAQTPTPPEPENPTANGPDARWQTFLGADAQPPAAAELPALLDGLVRLLDDPDPKRRDDIGYALLARWVLKDGIVGAEQLRSLLGKLTAGLDADGEHGVLRRSFSMLCLSVLAKRDLDAPWLTEADFSKLLARSIRFLAEERDPRGYDDELGWVHCAAHTADTLKFLARNQHLDEAGQAAIVDAVCERVATTEITWTAGEDMRLARALLAICARDDFDADALRERLGALRKRRADGAARQIALGQNRIHLLLSLFALLELDRREQPSIVAARKVVRTILGG